MKGGELVLLCELARRGASQSSIRVSTADVAAALECSQQSVSRRLGELESSGLISRSPSHDGTTVRISRGGLSQLESFMSSLAARGSDVPKSSIAGKVQVGLGEGKYYMSQEGYTRQFAKKLGAELYPGTLNVLCNYVEKAKFAASLCDPIVLEGFTTHERTFGRVLLYSVRVNGLNDCFILVPERSVQESAVLEIAAPFNLREKLGLKTGDNVAIEA